jgi:hypothetical protein
LIKAKGDVAMAAGRKIAPLRRPWMIKLIVVVLVLYGLYGPALQLFGSSASARISEVRRTGGAEPQLFHRYWWSIGYVFTAADGQRYSGHTRALAPDYGPQGYRPIEPVYYLAAFPAANVLARDAGPHAGTGVMLAIAVLLVWLTGPRAGNRALSGRSMPTVQSEPAQLEPMSPAQTERWMRTYRRHARIYAWGFFLLMIPLVLLLIWFEVRVIDQEVLLALAFFVAVFFLLARWSRRATTAGWRGVVADKHEQGVRSRRQVIEIETERTRHRIPVSTALFDYFDVGDSVFKVAGFDWPEKLNLVGQSRACIVCGEVVDRAAAHCPRCAAPMPEHATLVRSLA